MAAVVASGGSVSVLESGPKMAEHGGGGGLGPAGVAPNGAGNGLGDVGMPKSEGDRSNMNEKRKERNAKRGGGSRFEPYASPSRRYRAFITNIPFDVKWQYLKDLVKEKVGEVTYVELLMDAEGKSRGCAVVEFKMEESMKKAVEVLNKHSLSGRPLKVKEDPDGEHVRRAVQKAMSVSGSGMGIGPGPGGPGMVNIPPSILNNPNIPNEIIHALQAGRLGSTVFVANLDYKVGWKKLKEVFSMAGVVVRADILEDKEGKSRGIGTVTFEQAIEAVQAISMFNGQLLFDRPMHVKMDERALPKGDFFPPERPQQLPHGLGGIGMGLGPGGIPIDANHLNKGLGMGNLGPGGMEGPFTGMENLGRFPSGMNLGRMNEMDRAIGGGFERDFPRNEMGMPRSFGDTLERGIGGGGGASLPAIDRMAPGLDRMATGLERLPSGMGHGIERVGSEMDRMGMVLDRMGSGVDRMGSGLDRMAPLGIDHLASGMDRMGAAGMERMGAAGMERMGAAGMGFGMDRMGSAIDRVGTTMDRMGAAGVERMGAAGMDRMGLGMDRMVPAGMGPVMDRMPAGLERIGAAPLDRMGLDRLAATNMDRMGLERMGAAAAAAAAAAATGMERMGPAMGQGLGGAGLDRMGLAMGSTFERTMEMDRGNFAAAAAAGNFAGGLGSGGPVPATAATVGVARKACQIFVRNLPFDFTWKMLKDKFNECGHVLYADIKMENGKSKGCGVVRFESPEVAERACRMMNGIQLRGREIDVRIDRNA
ncbi:heterogeneous nuclear ribonucleoprotein M isoform X2 [Sceloporus undulatus]|uniref:heterogeneous nuclear ribonucleoprotein M isoform X2 n=1 Tax=Sceloporus undulatus TaxID=8520 RepID=UPI001C4AF75E|nr:heterogeneous nuclear ribonucleoprotein M isoform X2 [Sceloporus undulatus]